jgi:pimeloyl-ACP methyl ester carboxylesterase
VNPSQAEPRPHKLRLRTGRTLAWYEYGDPAGRPCFFTPGTPACGLAGIVYHAKALKAGVRWLSLDKPGYGYSSFQPRRRLAYWPRDIAALADHLGLERFTVAGESGGGPHALALARYLPQRVTHTLVIAGMAPWQEALMRKYMSPANFAVVQLAKHNPKALAKQLSAMHRTLNNPKQRAAWIQKEIEESPPPDRRLFKKIPDLAAWVCDAYRGALRQGPQGAVQEMRMLTRFWGFEPEEIAVPVFLWHGTEDTNVPVQAARELAKCIPGCVAHFIKGAGHGLYDHENAMMAAVVD